MSLPLLEFSSSVPNLQRFKSYQYPAEQFGLENADKSTRTETKKDLAEIARDSRVETNVLAVVCDSISLTLLGVSASVPSARSVLASPRLLVKLVALSLRLCTRHH